jgi:hypothetical protein
MSFSRAAQKLITGDRSPKGRRALVVGLAGALLLATVTVSAASAGRNPGASGKSVPAAALVPFCLSTQLSARIARWDGAAGSLYADVRLVNTSFATCALRNNPRLQLVSAHGTVLIQGAPASTTAAIHTLTPLGFLKAAVRTANYCGPTPATPVTLAFRLPGSLGRIVAMPVSATDPTVPGCPGPGSPGQLDWNAAWH